MRERSLAGHGGVLWVGLSIEVLNAGFVIGDGFFVLFVGHEAVRRHVPGFHEQLLAAAAGRQLQSDVGERHALGRCFAAGLTG